MKKKKFAFVLMSASTLFWTSNAWSASTLGDDISPIGPAGADGPARPDGPEAPTEPAKPDKPRLPLPTFDNDYCGPSCSWRLSDDGKTLIIKGSDDPYNPGDVYGQPTP